MSKILVLPDKQVRPDNFDMNIPIYAGLGNLIVKERPDIIVDIGDHWDMFSLNQYDNKKKAQFDGDEVMKDVNAGCDAMDIILSPLRYMQHQQRQSKHKVYNPVMDFLVGNHEQRIKRFPELNSMVNYSTLLEGTPFTVHDYLKPVEHEGIMFSHYFYNALSGSPVGGSAEYRLNKLKFSFVQGHEQTFKHAKEYLNDGRVISALIGGACYAHNEPYKGHQGNNHFRGCFILHDAHDGDYDLEQISISRLVRNYA